MNTGFYKVNHGALIILTACLIANHAKAESRSLAAECVTQRSLAPDRIGYVGGMEDLGVLLDAQSRLLKGPINGLRLLASDITLKSESKNSYKCFRMNELVRAARNNGLAIQNTVTSLISLPDLRENRDKRELIRRCSKEVFELTNSMNQAIDSIAKMLTDPNRCTLAPPPTPTPLPTPPTTNVPPYHPCVINPFLTSNMRVRYCDGVFFDQCDFVALNSLHQRNASDIVRMKVNEHITTNRPYWISMVDRAGGHTSDCKTGEFDHAQLCGCIKDATSCGSLHLTVGDLATGGYPSRVTPEPTTTLTFCLRVD